MSGKSANSKGAARRVFRTSGEDDKRPLPDFLSRHCPEVPVGFLKKLIRKGFVAVDGQDADLRTRLMPGQRVALSLPEGAFIVAPNTEVRFEIVYEDDSLVVVDKPAGLITEPGIGHKLDTLLNGLVARYGETQDRLGAQCDFGMVHRLDRDTSGLLVVARQASVQRALRAEFRARRVSKSYVGLLLGSLPQEKGTVRIPIGRTRRHGRAIAFVDRPGTQSAVTEYRVVERFECATLVEAIPRTGRWRQIRLHFQAIGHPVAGDAEHGDAEGNAMMAERYGLGRMFLHARGLRFTHPKTDREVSFSAPLPAELDRVLKALRNDKKFHRRGRRALGGESWDT